MKRFFAIGGIGLVVVVLAALVVLRAIGLDPKERRPGLWLSGEHAAAPAGDWSFTDKYPTIYIQTRTRYLLPHAVTITCVSRNGQLYLTSTYREGVQFPQGKLWTENVMRDPRVRLKIGERVYDQRVTLVTDDAERAAVLESKAKKYPGQRVAKTATVYLFKVLPN